MVAAIGTVHNPCIFQGLLVGLQKVGGTKQTLLAEVLQTRTLVAVRLGRGRPLHPLLEIPLGVNGTAALELVGVVRLQLEEAGHRRRAPRSLRFDRLSTKYDGRHTNRHKSRVRTT